MRTRAIHAWDYTLESGLEEALEARKEALTGGAPADFPAYRELVGEIRGIQFAIRELIQVRAKYAQDGDAE